jgi:hypothetical protein
MLRLTDAFIWEDLPRTDHDTGSLAMAAWIPRIKKISTFLSLFAICTFFIQYLTLYFASDDHSFVYPTWYPFDSTKSPVYELTNLVQITVCVRVCFCACERARVCNGILFHRVFYMAWNKMQLTSNEDNRTKHMYALLSVPNNVIFLIA